MILVTVNGNSARSLENITFTIDAPNYDIKKDEENLPYLTINDQVKIFFQTPEDVESFVGIISELEIAAETFRAEPKDKDY